MLLLSTKLYEVPLFSIRSGGRIGTVTEPIINPHNLHIDGFYCTTPNHSDAQVLLDIHVRDISNRGVIIDDHNDLSKANELVRLQKIIQLNFKLQQKKAIVGKKVIGKINQFAVDTKSLFIQKLYVQPRGWQGLKTDSLTFDRITVQEVTDKVVIFQGPEINDSQLMHTEISNLNPHYSAANPSLMSE